MATFAYIARDSAGQRLEGLLESVSEQAALSDLSARGLTPVRITEHVERRGGHARVSVRSLAAAYRQLSDLLHAGVPLLRALNLLSRGKSNPRLSKVMVEVTESVAQGDRLADAMARHERVFPAVQVAMIRAGERGGFLENVLRRLADFLEHQADMRAKVVGQSIYPVILLFGAISLAIGALIFFVPKFEGYFKDIPLPVPTRILLGLSHLLVNWWGWLIVAVAALVAGGWWWARRPSVKRRLVALQLRIPVVGPIVMGLAIARFARMLGTLLDNGIAMLAAIRISRDAAGHVLLAEAIERAGEAVKSGGSLAGPLSDSGLFEADIVEMISIGESANNLPDVLVNVAESLEKRVERQLNVLVRLMEPAIFLCMALVVIFLFVALVVPMMRLSIGA